MSSVQGLAEISHWTDLAGTFARTKASTKGHLDVAEIKRNTNMSPHKSCSIMGGASAEPEKMVID
jgi:hypothetical protein